MKTTIILVVICDQKRKKSYDVETNQLNCDSTLLLAVYKEASGSGHTRDIAGHARA